MSEIDAMDELAAALEHNAELAREIVALKAAAITEAEAWASDLDAISLDVMDNNKYDAWICDSLDQALRRHYGGK